MPHNRRLWGGDNSVVVPQFELLGHAPKKPCAAIFSKLERWKNVNVIPVESIRKHLQIQLLRVFLT